MIGQFQYSYNPEEEYKNLKTVQKSVTTVQKPVTTGVQIFLTKKKKMVREIGAMMVREI